MYPTKARGVASCVHSWSAGPVDIAVPVVGYHRVRARADRDRPDGSHPDLAVLPVLSTTQVAASVSNSD